MHLSIVIPCYNEAHRLVKNLDIKIDFLSHYKYAWELVLVDDGSNDDTLSIIKKYITRHQSLPIRLISYPTNQGKGYAVKKGMLTAKGKFRLFSDLDNSTSIRQIVKLLDIINKYDIVVASRYIQGAVITKKQTIVRRIISRLGNLFIRIVIGLNLKDTQCGFKLFRDTAAKKIFSHLKSRRWGFDVEVLLLAKKLRYRIKEVPIIWTDTGDSKLQPLKASMMVFTEALKSKYNILFDKYNLNDTKDK